jgi:ribosomal protein S15P/S13E
MPRKKLEKTTEESTENIIEDAERIPEDKITADAETSSKKSAEEKPKRAKKSSKKKKEKPVSKKLSQEEYEKKVLELAKKGLTTEKIGEALRNEGIHPKEHGKKISKILKEKGIYQSPELKNVEAKLNKIVAHYAKNKQDKRAMRERERIFSQLRKIKKYLKIKN